MTTNQGPDDLPVRKGRRLLTVRGGWGDSKRAEVGAVEDLAKGLRKCGQRTLVDIIPRQETKPPTPPDVLARNERGGLVGIEVTELTDQDVIETNIQRSAALPEAVKNARTEKERLIAEARHSEQVRLWSGREVLDALENIIAKKDAKPFAEGSEPYAERWLVIYTGERFIEWPQFSAELPTRTFSPAQFDCIYLVRDEDVFAQAWWLIYARPTA